MSYHAEPSYQHGTPAKTAVLLVNLGTPEAPTVRALKPYLREFLSDPRVVEIPRLLWWPILHGVILSTRPAKSAEKYGRIWTPEGSPLKVHTERQAKLLLGFLSQRVKPLPVIEYAMRYGEPSIRAVLGRLRAQRCERILVLPLYPQYAASTSASVFDAVASATRLMRNVPALRTVKHFHDHPGYIGALAQNVRDYWMKTGRPDKLVMSFHGVPRFTLDRGDPYHCECQKTARLLGEALGLQSGQYLVTFQSRFGRAEWLKPYTAEVLNELGRQKLGRVDVVCPGFVSDCLETLEEIALEGKKAFLSAGGREFHYIPCLNERDDWIRALLDIALANLQGWLGTEESAEAATQSRQRALAMGAKS
ncbi:MAG: ferrochelatase [Betaproteobacteria bacterium]|nr:ferrochelatase [Betaproteobacteria bacterium]